MTETENKTENEVVPGPRVRALRAKNNQKASPLFGFEDSTPDENPELKIQKLLGFDNSAPIANPHIDPMQIALLMMLSIDDQTLEQAAATLGQPVPVVIEKLEAAKKTLGARTTNGAIAAAIRQGCITF